MADEGEKRLLFFAHRRMFRFPCSAASDKILGVKSGPLASSQIKVSRFPSLEATKAAASER